MTKRTFKTAVACSLCVAGVMGFVWYALEIYQEARRVGITENELRSIGMATHSFTRKFPDIEYWDRVHETEQFLAPIKSYLEAGRGTYHDGWDQPYLLDRRDEAQAIVLTLYSSRAIRKGVLGIEISISRSDGNATSVKHLWE